MNFQTNYLKCLFAIILILSTTSTTVAKKAKLRIMSYNMLFEYKTPDQPEQRWENRLPNAVANILKRKPDVIGSQELLTFQVNDIMERTGYKRAGGDLQKGRTDQLRTENEAIFYNPETLELLEDGNLWFSTTPHSPGSFSWGMKYPRMCTWAKLRYKKTGQVFYMLNSHFYVDADKEEARVEAAKIVLDKAHEVARKGYPVFCTGDFNGRPETRSIKQMLNDGIVSDARELARNPKGPVGTYHGFKQDYKPDSRIDFVMLSKEFTVKKYEVIDEQQKSGRFESDHLPVCVDVTL